MNGLNSLYDRTMTSPAQEITKRKQALEERVEELEAENARLRSIIYEDRAAFRRFRNCAKSQTVREDSKKRLADGKSALDGAEVQS